MERRRRGEEGCQKVYSPLLGLLMLAVLVLLRDFEDRLFALAGCDRNVKVIFPLIVETISLLASFIFCFVATTAAEESTLMADTIHFALWHSA